MSLLSHLQGPAGRLVWMLALLSLIVVSGISLAQQGRTYTFTVVPQLPALTLHRNWQPFLDRLSELTGYQFELKIYGNFADFEGYLYSGAPDFAYINPYQQMLLKQSKGYEPVIRDQSRQLSGILVVRNDSDIHTLKDIDNKTLVFSAPNAFAASVYLRTLLIDKEKISFRPVYVSTHANVYRTVIYGKAVAGGGVNKTLLAEPENIRSQLRVLYQTPGVSPHPVSVNPGVDSKVVNAVTSAVISMKNSKSDEKLLQAIHISDPVKADYKRDYQSLEKMNLTRYKSY